MIVSTYIFYDIKELIFILKIFRQFCCVILNIIASYCSDQNYILTYILKRIIINPIRLFIHYWH